MDYTKIPKIIIYRPKTIDKLAEMHPMNATIIKRLMKLETWEEKDPERVIAPCLNTAYYICTIMRMEKDATYRLQSYRSIAKQGYIQETNCHVREQCVTLSLVAVLIEHSTPVWRNKLQEIADELLNYAIKLREIREVESIEGVQYTQVIDLLGLPMFIKKGLDDSWVLPDELFQPRIINERVLFDIKYDPTFKWDKLLFRFADEEIHDLIDGLGKTQQEKATLIQSIWSDYLDTYKKLGIPLHNTYKLLKVIAQEFCPDCLKDTGLFNSQENNREESCSEIAKQEEIIQDLQNKAKGLTREQAPLFVHALATYLKFNFTNKKASLAPLTNKLFGWGVSSMEKRLTEGYSTADRNYVADLFKELKPEFAEHIKNFDKL